MNNDLRTIIDSSTFTVMNGHYLYLKVSVIPTQGNHFLVTRDEEEITVVTTEDQKKFVDIIEENKDMYCLISLNVSIPFYCVGFLAAVTEAIAEKGKNILIVSTYSKDYILVNIADTDIAIDVLQKLGFKNFLKARS
jgi:hypothetical protein